MDIIDKLRPKNLNDFIGNKSCIKKLLKTLEDNDFTGIYLISGKQGIGKNLLADLINKKYNFSSVNIELTKENYKENIQMFCTNSLSKISFVLDNFDLKRKKSAIYKHKKYIKFLNDYHENIKHNLFFLICNSSGIKKEIKNITLSNILRITKPEKLNIEIKNLYEKNNFIISDKVNSLILEIIIKNEHSIYGSLMTINMMLFGNKNKNKISKTKESIEFVNSYKIDREKELFDSVSIILSNNTDNEIRSELFFTNYSLIPYFIYDNYLKKIIYEKDKYKDKKTQDKYHNIILEDMKNISCSFTDFSILNKKMLETQNYKLINYLSYASVISPMINLKKHNVDTKRFFFPKMGYKKKDNLEYEKWK